MDNRKNKEELDTVIEEITEDENTVEETPIIEEEVTEDVAPVEPENDEEPVVEEEVAKLKTKLGDSSREAQTLFFKNKKFDETIEKAATIAEPTEEDLRIYAMKQGTNYDDLGDFERNLLKKTLINEQKFDMVYKLQQESKKVDEWADKLDAFIDDERNIAKYPSLEQNSAEFRKFSMKETRRGMDFDDLVASFSYMHKDTSPKHKGSLLNPQGNGAQAPARPNKLTDEDAMKIRNRSPKEYNRLVREGKINIDI